MTHDIAEDRINQMLIDDKIRGKSYAFIADKHGLPVEDVMRRLREVYLSTTIRDPLEHRALLQLRIERVIDNLWDGLEGGNFKNGEAVLKAVNTLQELHDLNEKSLVHQVTIVTDDQAAMVFQVLDRAATALRDKVLRLELPDGIQKQLEAWPEWAADSATNAVEDVLLAEVIEED